MSEPPVVPVHHTESLARIISVLDDPVLSLQSKLQRSVTVRYLKQAIVSLANKEMVLQLPSEQAGKLISVMQEILDDPESYHPGSSADENFLLAVFRLFMRLAQHSKVLPPNLFLTGVALESREPIGFGGFSDVFKGTYNGKAVALKRLRVSVGSSNGGDYFHRTFHREALLWRQLRHRYVLPFIGVDRHTFSGYFCMISPWMHKGTIHEFSQGNIGISERLRLVQEVAEGMAYLHSRHVVHGDIRGLNIFITDDIHVQLADFGLSAIGDMTSIGIVTATKESGAKRWMAPELLDPEKFMMQFERTPPSDTFAYGSVCLEVFTGRPPFYEMSNEVAVMLRMLDGQIPPRPAPADSFGHGVPDQLWDLMRGCWAYRPADRPTMQTLALAIDEFRPRSPKALSPPIPTAPLTVAVPSKPPQRTPTSTPPRPTPTSTPPQPTPTSSPSHPTIDISTSSPLPIVPDLISFDSPLESLRVSSTPRAPLVSKVTRAAFGVPLEESLRFAEIERIPAVVLRCIEYLEANGAEKQKGIYHVSGNTGIIKALRARFDTDGDVDLAHARCDVHAVAGLLTLYFRELPTKLFPLAFSAQFVRVSGHLEPDARMHMLALLVSRLPPPHYWLLRAMCAHLRRIVQYAHLNSMTPHNFAITLWPLLGVPMRVIRPMISHFALVFGVDACRGASTAAVRSPLGWPLPPPAPSRAKRSLSPPPLL